MSGSTLYEFLLNWFQELQIRVRRGCCCCTCPCCWIIRLKLCPGKWELVMTKTFKTNVTSTLGLQSKWDRSQLQVQSLQPQGGTGHPGIYWAKSSPDEENQLNQRNQGAFQLVVLPGWSEEMGKSHIGPSWLFWKSCFQNCLTDLSKINEEEAPLD